VLSPSLCAVPNNYGDDCSLRHAMRCPAAMPLIAPCCNPRLLPRRCPRQLAESGLCRAEKGRWRRDGLDHYPRMPCGLSYDSDVKSRGGVPPGWVGLAAAFSRDLETARTRSISLIPRSKAWFEAGCSFKVLLYTVQFAVVVGIRTKIFLVSLKYISRSLFVSSASGMYCCIGHWALVRGCRPLSPP
jgi:hypothetical protein